MSCGYPCGPSCFTPTYVPSCGPSYSYPVGGLGSLGSCAGVGGALSYGGGAVPASSLGVVPGANVGCVTQAPSSEVVIKPSPCIVTLPGPVLTTCCEPVRVGGFSACGGSPCGVLSGGPGLYGSRRGPSYRPC